MTTKNDSDDEFEGLSPTERTRLKIQKLKQKENEKKEASEKLFKEVSKELKESKEPLKKEPEIKQEPKGELSGTVEKLAEVVTETHQDEIEDSNSIEDYYDKDKQKEERDRKIEEWQEGIDHSICPKTLNRDRTVTWSAKGIFHEFHIYCKPKKFYKDGKIVEKLPSTWIDAQTIADGLQMDVSQVYKEINALKRSGYMKRKWNKRFKNTVTTLSPEPNQEWLKELKEKKNEADN